MPKRNDNKKNAAVVPLENSASPKRAKHTATATTTTTAPAPETPPASTAVHATPTTITAIEIKVPISEVAHRCIANLEANRYIGTGMTTEQLCDVNVQMEVAVLLQHRPDLMKNMQSTVDTILTMLARLDTMKAKTKSEPVAAVTESVAAAPC